MCMYMADSLCYKAETNTPLQSNYTPKKMFKKKKKKENLAIGPVNNEEKKIDQNDDMIDVSEENGLHIKERPLGKWIMPWNIFS